MQIKQHTKACHKVCVGVWNNNIKALGTLISMLELNVT